MVVFGQVVVAALTLALQTTTANPATQLILTRGVGREAAPQEIREQFDRFRARVRELADVTEGEAGGVTQEVRAIDVSLDDTRSRVASHLGLTLYRALRVAHATSAFAFDYQPSIGVLRVVGFDDRRGIEASASVKLENDHEERARLESTDDAPECGRRGDRDAVDRDDRVVSPKPRLRRRAVRQEQRHAGERFGAFVRVAPTEAEFGRLFAAGEIRRNHEQ